MAEQNRQTSPDATPDLRVWLAQWPAVRSTVEKRLAAHAQHDPSLHFELTLAELELKDIDDAVRRMGALGKILYGDDLTDAELQGTGNY